MAGDEDRPPSEPQTTGPNVHGVAGGTPLDGEPDRPPVAGLDHDPADLAAADRPSESFVAPSYQPQAIAPAQRSIMPTVLSLIGGVLILLLAANLYTLYNPPANEAIPALQRDVAALKQQVAALPKVDLAPLDGKVAALAGDMDALKAAVAKAADPEAVAAQTKAAVAPLEGRASEIEKALAAIQGTLTAVPKLETQTSDLGKGLAAVQGAVAALPKVDLGPLDAKVAEADKRLVPLEAYFSAPKATDQVTDARMNGSAAESRAAPLAVIAQGVTDSIAGGRPFEPEVKALAALGVDAATLQPLQAVAAKGAATDADLVAGFAGVQDGVVVAAAPVQTGTMFDRMMANAQSLVKVSKIGASPGDDTGAIASRITATLKRGDLTAAAAAWDTLPDASKARSAEWAGRLKARIAAAEAARSISTKAVAALAAAE